MEQFHVMLTCPACHAAARLVAFEPAATDHVIAWTDGYREIGGASPPPQIARCRACDALYWTDMATPVGLQVAAGTAPVIEMLDENGHYQAIEQGLGSDHDHEIAVRVLAWWRGNDRFRKTVGGRRYPTDGRATRNLERLVDLCISGEHEVLLTRVEALRQLGRFEEAVETLSGICRDYEFAAVRFMSLIAARSRDLDVLFN